MLFNFQTILDGLRKRTNSKNEILIQLSGGELEIAKFEFNPPARIEEIDFISKKYNVNLPNDYVEFMCIHNGAKLFDVGFGEFTEIYHLNKVDENSELMPDTIRGGLIPVAHYPSGTIYLDTTREKCIFTNDSSQDFNFMSMNFGEWLEALILANGKYFWEWTPQMLYRTIDNRELRVKEWLIDGFN
ncbi:SMI1/KNR4 family protein [Paenibacillus fonticola]|uniref:SMI1/KNR4 family protein n=1 Tax=Paenibacillus fonticola TaxID=379896 RepID=UPI00037F0FE9|nr:SMI1/KNR4 family protein [Paenibacillus fonticola]